jgi:hypothetical protein
VNVLTEGLGRNFQEVGDLLRYEQGLRGLNIGTHDLIIVK